MPLRVIFFGTAELACASLRRLTEDPQFQVLAVVSQPDKPKGRDLRLQPSAVKQLALDRNLPVLQPRKARDAAFIEQLRGFRPDLMVVAAYGQILPQELLDVPRLGCLNVHTSLLPRHRGAAPIQWAILSGDQETGITIMKMDAGLDTGPILAMARTPIAPEDDSRTLHDRLADMGAELLVRTIADYAAGEITPVPQPEGATYARKISKEDGRIEWQATTGEIWNRIRAFTPWPGAFTFLPGAGKSRLLKIWDAQPRATQAGGSPGTILNTGAEGILAACGEGSLLIRALQLAGSRKMTAAEFLAGHKLAPGTVLGNPPE